MTVDAARTRAELAAMTMQRNRAELRAVFADRAATSLDGFPRSATLRWILARVSPSAIAWTVLTSVLARFPISRIVGGTLFGRRR